jgi:hypothetical protein
MLVIWLLGDEESTRSQPYYSVCKCINKSEVFDAATCIHSTDKLISSLMLLSNKLVHCMHWSARIWFLIQHWSVSVETATGWWVSSEWALTHPHSYLGFQVFMAGVDQMMSSGFWHCAGLWVVTDVSEKRGSIFRVAEVWPNICRAER